MSPVWLDQDATRHDTSFTSPDCSLLRSVSDLVTPSFLIARTQRHPLRRVLRLSGLAGVAHVAPSLILGAIIIGVGLLFRSTVERHQNLIVGCLLIATGAVFLFLELRGRGHGQNHDEHGGHSQ